MSKALNQQRFTKGSPIRFELQLTAVTEDHPVKQLNLLGAIVEIEFYPTKADRSAQTNRLLLLSTPATLTRLVDTATALTVIGMVNGATTATWIGEIFYRAWVTPTTGIAIGERFSDEVYEGSFAVRS